AAYSVPITTAPHVDSYGGHDAPRPAWGSLTESLAALDEEILALTVETSQLHRSMNGLTPDDELAELIRRLDLQLRNLGGRRDLLRSLTELERYESADLASTADIGPPRRPVEPSDTTIDF
ncbi:MAG: hypothetical protein JSV91_02865, partial [Phycisphaerales bacterium]